jgi:hypothetical protein
LGEWMEGRLRDSSGLNIELRVVYTYI